ncbi:hypothetical protein [Virgibacillus siamensis]|uniref:hypothetical protein n=1 Tax=Virgibacillus siamensis TaxID=480071 RepID=UPI00158E3BDC|nr:hypothetical protein [Virgibacillus siamensis]
MTRTKWVLILLGSMDLLLILMHFTDYFILLLKPTGYLIPLAINIIAFAFIGFRSSRVSSLWIIAGLVPGILFLLMYGFIILLEGHNYAKIGSSYNQKSIVIEYSHFTLGETTYYYDFYETNFGIIGKHLNDQSIKIMVPGTKHVAGMNAKNTLGLNEATWVTKNVVRFPTSQGMKDVYLKPSESPKKTVNDIEAFMELAKNKENGKSITVNGNRLTIRFDERSGESWIEVTGNYGKGAIPRQQCSRIVANEKRGYYMLVECTHQWEYPLIPIPKKK